MVARAGELGWRLPLIGLLVIAVALAAFAAGVAAQRTFARPNGTTIYACQGERSGTLRIVDQGESCLRGEVPLSWNSVGPAGPPGVDLTPSVTGFVNADGTIGVGGGLFTVQALGGGVYQLEFPAGTWDGAYNIVATPTGINGFLMVIVENWFLDGSVIAQVILSTDTSFTFIATQLPPSP